MLVVGALATGVVEFTAMLVSTIDEEVVDKASRVVPSMADSVVVVMGDGISELAENVVDSPHHALP